MVMYGSLPAAVLSTPRGRPWISLLFSKTSTGSSTLDVESPSHRMAIRYALA